MNLEEEEEVADICDCGNEHFCSIKCGEFLEYLRTG
jgi:predicted nucleic acid-binding Zn ribbon protein